MNNKTIFVRTDRELKKPVKGQAAVVLEAIEARGTEGGTLEQLGKDVTSTLVTRQDPERVVAYYACIFKKQGVVRAIRPDDNPPVEEPETEDEDETEDELESVE